MKSNKDKEKEKLIQNIEKAIKLLCEKNISEVVILSSYKIHSVLKDNYGMNLRVDKIGRILSTIAKRNKLKRLTTNIPKYKLHISNVSDLKFF
ncbi:MAG: hypothetical protein R6U96_08720 [Promethearchaeia archaeon]